MTQWSSVIGNVATDVAAIPEPHDHQVYVDKDGNGRTAAIGLSGDSMHSHEIRGWVVQEALGHTHTLPYRLLQVARPNGYGQTALRNPVKKPKG